MTLSRRAALPLLFALLLSCEDGVTTEPPGTALLPLGDGLWHVNTIDTAVLPAKISERFVGAALEEIFLDSAQISIDNLSGSYEQRYWTQVYLTGVVDRSEFVFDEGTFQLGSGAYVFNSTVRSRTFTMTTPSTAEVRTSETMAFHNDATPVAGSYRRTRP